MKDHEISEGDKNIAKVLNINLPEVIPAQTDIVNEVQPVAPSPTGDSDIDYRTIRNNIKNLINTTDMAIEGIMSVATEGDSPRAYEVVSELIKTSLEANNKLIELHKAMKDLKKEEKSAKGDTVTNNSIFVGNTTDLLKMIKQKKVVLPIEAPKDES
jgi:Terminase DNA packaging enzyme